MKNFYFLVIFGVLIALAGCLQFKPVEDRTRYYVLSPVMQSDVKEHTGKIIGVGKVYVSDYLGRHELVTSDGANELKLNSFHRWAESFDKMVMRVLAEDLSGYLGSNYTVVSSPYRLNEKRDYEVFFRINEFQGVEPNNEVYLFGLFQIKDNVTGEIVKEEEIRVWKRMESEEYSDLAHAMSESLGDVSKVIGDSIRAFELLSPS